jgi:hypothetical protein
MLTIMSIIPIIRKRLLYLDKNTIDIPNADNAVPINGYVQKQPNPKNPNVVEIAPPVASIPAVISCFILYDLLFFCFYIVDVYQCFRITTLVIPRLFLSIISLPSSLSRILVTFTLLNSVLSTNSD